MKKLNRLLSTVTLLVLVVGLSTCDDPEVPVPEITSINPTEGAVGTAVTITGKNFPAFESLQFGSVSTTSIASKTDTEIVTVAPPGLSPGNITVAVKTDGGTSNSISFKVLA